MKLYGNASESGLGTCLVHLMPDKSERPVAYASRTLTAPEQNNAQTEREALSIVFTVCIFHQYLYGRSFTLVTDHHPLCKMFLVKMRVFHRTHAALDIVAECLQLQY